MFSLVWKRLLLSVWSPNPEELPKTHRSTKRRGKEQPWLLCAHLPLEIKLPIKMCTFLKSCLKYLHLGLPWLLSLLHNTLQDHPISSSSQKFPTALSAKRILLLESLRAAFWGPSVGNSTCSGLGTCCMRTDLNQLVQDSNRNGKEKNPQQKKTKILQFFIYFLVYLENSFWILRVYMDSESSWVKSWNKELTEGLQAQEHPWTVRIFLSYKLPEAESESWWGRNPPHPLSWSFLH